MIFPQYSELKKLSWRGRFDLAVATLLGLLLAVILSPLLLPLWVVQRVATGLK